MLSLSFSAGLLWVFILPPDTRAEELTFGFFNEQLSEEYHSLSKTSSEVLRQLVTLTLTRESNSPPGFSLFGAASLRGTPSTGKYVLGLKPGLRFHSGQLIESDDVVASLLRCQQQKVLPENLKVQQLSEVEIELRTEIDKAGGQEIFREIPVSLASCIIFPALLLELFEDHLSSGTGLVSGGPYIIESFKPGGPLSLRRFASYFQEGKRADIIHFRSFDDPGHAVTALRLGTIAAFWPPASHGGLPDAEQRVKEDDTLKIVQCNGRKVFARTTFKLTCSPGLDTRFISLETGR